nr:EcsC family protein [Allorhizocola rhizosphaerae]
MRADPTYAPEHLAAEAVRVLGPRAAAWTAYVRTVQPHVSADDLAQIAAKKFANLASLTGAVSGAAGLPGAIVDFGVLAWNQARMVLSIAAAYGHDPQDPDRATDLLVLQRVHGMASAARLALGVAAGRTTAGTAMVSSGGTARVVGQLSLKLARMAGMRAVKRVAAKVVPGASIVFGSWANRSATRDLAARAITHYRPSVPAQRTGEQ